MRILLIIPFFILIASCKKDNPLNEDSFLNQGSYIGYFQCDTLVLWEAISITDDEFIEVPSGGIMMGQKYFYVSLTKGNYKIIDSTITFYNIQIALPRGEMTEGYQNEFLLSGDFTINNHSDSTIIFWKNSANGKQLYNLKNSNPRK